MKKVLLAFLTAMLGSTAPSDANDSTATMGAGGLVYTTSSKIRIERENLFISEDEITVAYDFFNESEEDISTLVAFPLPDLDFDGDWNYAIETRDPVNWIGFKVTVDGKEIMPQVQARATRFGVDVTEVLQRYGIPITMLSGPDDLIAMDERLSALPPEAKAELLRYGVIDWSSSWGANNVPLPTYHWTSQIIFYWFQTFPAGKTLHVEHRYKPVSGYSFVTVGGLEEEYLQREFCIDKNQRKLILTKLNTEREEMMSGINLRYVVVTAGNWLGPIGKFSMTIDKGDPGAIIATCWKGLKQTGPQSLRFEEENFQPDEDVNILLIKPFDRNE